jgi:hypothetical protein
MDRENPPGVDVQAISSAVCGAVVSAFSEVLNRNPGQGQSSYSTAGAARAEPTVQPAQAIHPPVSNTITRFVRFIPFLCQA